MGMLRWLFGDVPDPVRPIEKAVDVPEVRREPITLELLRPRGPGVSEYVLENTCKECGHVQNEQDFCRACGEESFYTAKARWEWDEHCTLNCAHNRWFHQEKAWLLENGFKRVDGCPSEPWACWYYKNRRKVEWKPKV